MNSHEQQQNKTFPLAKRQCIRSFILRSTHLFVRFRIPLECRKYLASIKPTTMAQIDRIRFEYEFTESEFQHGHRE